MTMTTTETRNSKVLKDFVAYCEANPTLRFWQALRAWSGHNFIVAAKNPTDEGMGDYWDGTDTFYWEGKDK